MKSFAVRLWNSPTITSWGSLAVRLSSVLIILPLVLVKFSPSEVSVWQLFATLFSIVLLLDFGLSPTFTRMLAFARGGATLADMSDMRGRVSQGRSPDPKTIVAVFSALRWLYPRLALFVVCIFAVLGTLALQRPIEQIADPTMAWVAWSLVLASSAVGFWGNAYSVALQGMNSIAPLRRLEVASGLAQISTSLLVLINGGSLMWLVVTYQFWVVFGVVRNRILLKKMHPELFSRPAEKNTEVLRVLWPATWRSGVGVLMSQGIIQMSGVIYSQLGTAQEVAAYLLALRVMTMISQFAQAPFYSKLPRLAELQAMGDKSTQIVIAQKGMRMAHWIFALGAITVAFLVQPMLDLIGSRTQFVSPGIWALMSLAFFAERFGAMHLQLFSLTNKIVWHIANGVTGSLMIAIAAISYSYIHQYSFPLAMLLAYACFYCTYSASKSYAAFSLPFAKFELNTSFPAAAVMFSLLIVAHQL